MPSRATSPVQGSKKARTFPLIIARRRATEYGIYTYPNIQDILSKSFNTFSPAEEQPEDNALTPHHHNIRGKEY